ncbi:MAG: hypothetical protein ACLFS6_03005 [Methanomassiliicoccales archaeon]
MKGTDDPRTQLVEFMRRGASSTLYTVMMALLVWLFGVLVFIPIAGSFGAESRGIVTLVIFLVFAVMLLRSVPGLRRFIDLLSVVLARKYGVPRGADEGQARVYYRSLVGIVSLFVVYLLFLPLLLNFHHAIAGIVLILVIMWAFALFLRVLKVLAPSLERWLSE